MNIRLAKSGNVTNDIRQTLTTLKTIISLRFILFLILLTNGKRHVITNLTTGVFVLLLKH